MRIPDSADLLGNGPGNEHVVLEGQNSVKKTGRLVVAHEDSVNISLSSEVAARITEEAFYHLEAPVLRVGGFDVPYPSAKLEELFLPDADRILEAIDRALAY
jgi:pyruvate dehydrogenase E1 component beta subunit